MILVLPESPDVLYYIDRSRQTLVCSKNVSNNHQNYFQLLVGNKKAEADCNNQFLLFVIFYLEESSFFISSSNE